MRRFLGLSCAVALAAPAAASDLRWPNPQIEVPPLVSAFIEAECRYAHGQSSAEVDACIVGERYGHRAVVMMLTDEATGDRAARRYRACRDGLGEIGGRFHRNRATCMAGLFGYKWRFEFSREAARRDPARDGTDNSTRYAAAGVAVGRLVVPGASKP